MSGRYGHKYPLMAAAVPQLLGWILIIFARNPMYLYMSRFLSGLSGGATHVIIPVYVAEFSDNRVRGALGSLLMLFLNVGIVISFTVGYFCTYSLVPKILTLIPILFLMCMPFIPESPLFLIRSGREEEAKKSICFYRNIDWPCKEDTSELSVEMNRLKESVNTNKQADLNEDIDGITWRDFTTPVARKALFIGVTIVMVKKFSGIYVLINYAGSIFVEAGSEMDPKLCAIIIGCIQLSGTYVPTLLVDRAGRKILLTFSLLGTGIGLVIMGAFMYLQSIDCNLDEYYWIPLASVSFALFVASCGLFPIPYIILSEIMPPKIRLYSLSLCMNALWLFSFIISKCYPILSNAIGIHGCFFMFGGVAIFGALFVIWVVPETKGKSFDEIMRLLNA